MATTIQARNEDHSHGAAGCHVNRIVTGSAWHHHALVSQRTGGLLEWRVLVGAILLMILVVPIRHYELPVELPTTPTVPSLPVPTLLLVVIVVMVIVKPF